MRSQTAVVARSLAIAGRARSIALQAQQPAPQPPQVPRPSFETKAEIVLVDVNVVDRDAKPVRDPDAGRLRARGQRPAAQDRDGAVHLDDADQHHARRRRAKSAYTSNESATTGRLLLFVVDEGSLRVGANRTVLRSGAIAVRSARARRSGRPGAPAERLRRRRVHRRSQAHHRRLDAGHRRRRASRVGMTHVNISEAWALESNDDGHVPERGRPRMRGHDRPRPRSLPQPARSRRARDAARGQRARPRDAAVARGLLKNLAPLKTPVNIVMMSEGMFVARDRAEHDRARPPRRRSARRPFTSSGRRSSSSTSRTASPAAASSRFFDDGLMSEGLEQVAGQTRGSMSVVNGDGADRVRSTRPRAVRLLPARLRADRSRSHRPRAAHQGRR